MDYAITYFMYISSFNTYIDSIRPYSKQQSSTILKSSSDFKEVLASKQLETYTFNKSFPVDYVNKESTFFNKLRMYTPKDPEISQTLEESYHVSNFDILKKRSQSYTTPINKINVFSKYTQALTPNLGETKFDVQKQKIANIYLQNDAYFNKIAI